MRGIRRRRPMQAMDGTELLGMLNVYHDEPHPWSADELETIAALATQASVAIRTAQNFQRMSFLRKIFYTDT